MIDDEKQIINIERYIIKKYGTRFLNIQQVKAELLVTRPTIYTHIDRVKKDKYNAISVAKYIVEKLEKKRWMIE